MICCKIVANYTCESGNFSDLLNELGDFGDLFWDGQYLYYAETETDHISENKIKKLLKKTGFGEGLIIVYSQKTQPNSSESGYWWVIDKCSKINYNKFEKEGQQVFKNILIGLDQLDKEIEELSKNKELQDKEVRVSNG